MKLEEATPAQREAITTKSKNVVVAAGPGSGKTATVVKRIETILEEGSEGSEIVCLSFTNAAANELRSRLPEVPTHVNGDESMPPTLATVELGFVGTLHSFALKMLKEHGTPFGYGIRTAIIAPDSAVDLMASKATSLNCKTPVEQLLKTKARLGRPPRGKRLTLDETVIASYLDELKEAKVVDYDVLLHEFLEMLTSGDPNALSAQQSLIAVYSHLFVDEAQDSSPVQWAIYRALPIESKFYVGDADQNLYEFAGARVREMIDEGAKPETLLIRLEENFRSRIEICAAAQAFIERNENRVAKKTISVRGYGGYVTLLGEFENEGEEIGAVARKIKEMTVVDRVVRYAEGEKPDLSPSVGPDDLKKCSITVLARTNAIADGFRRSLPSMGVPIVERKRYALPKDWLRARSLIEVLIDPENDSLAYFFLVARCLAKGMTNAAARKEAQRMRVGANASGETINRRFLGMTAITRPESALAALVGAGISREAHMIAVEKWREMPPGSTLDEFALSLASVMEYEKEAEGDGVRILTIHGAKGKEFDVVFFVGLEDETIPGRGAENPDSLEGERRAAFVALTRARTALYLSSVKSRVTPWKAVVPRKPSRFLNEILGK